MADTASSKLAKIREELNRMFLERIDLIDGAIVALLSANHVLIIGPPERRNRCWPTNCAGESKEQTIFSGC